MDKKVSIVIPTFNRANLLVKTIESALNQTVKCEIIVCDHGSSDNTPEVMEKYKNKVKYIRRDKDLGMHFCWLEGGLSTTNDLIHIHYDDDYMEPTFIERTLSMMGDDVGLCFCDATLYDMKNDIRYPHCLQIGKKFGNSGIYDVDKLEAEILNNGLMLSPAACLYRKKDVIDALYQGELPLDFGGNYKGVGPDHFMTLLCLLRYKKFACITDDLVVFGAHDSSITIDASKSKQKKQAIDNAYNAIRKFYLFLKQIKNNNGENINLSLPVQRVYKYIYLLGIPVIKTKTSYGKKRIYLLGLPLISLKEKRK